MAGDEKEKEERREKVGSLLNSLAMSEKGGIQTHRLEREYRMYCEPAGLPFREFGFSCLEDMLVSFKDAVYVVRGPDGTFLVKPVVKQETAHINALVSGQRKKKVPKMKKNQRSAVVRSAASCRGRGGGFTFGSGSPQSRFVPPLMARVPMGSSSRGVMPTRGAFGAPRPSYNSNNNPLASRLSYPQPATKQARPGFKPYTPPATRTEPANEFVPSASNLPRSNISIDVLMKRIVDLVAVRAQGVFATRLPFDYENKYKQAAPENLITVAVKSMNKALNVEKIGGREILYPRLEPSSPVKAAAAPTQPKTNGVHADHRNAPQLDFTADALPEIGEQLVVYVTHIDSLERFFVQAADSPIGDLSERLQLHCANQKSSATSTYATGACCAALYEEDNVWYRAKILSVIDRPKRGASPSEPAEPSCRVLFVDYGNQAKVPFSKIQPLEPAFFSLPMQVFQCCLDGVVPLNRAKHNEDVIEHFHGLVHDAECVLTIKEYNGAALRVDLSKEDVPNMSMQLIKDKRVLGTPDYAKDIADSASYQQESSSDTDSLVSGSCNQGSASLVGTIANLKIEGEVKLRGQPAVLPEEDGLDVFICHINNTDDFYFNIRSEQYYDALLALQKKMFLTYREDRYTIDIATVDTYYALCSAHTCYRVTLQAVQGDKCTAYYCDSGNVAEVDVADLRQLHDSFLRLPFQAFRAALDGIPEGVDSAILDAFVTVALGNPAVAFIVQQASDSNGNKVVVELIDALTNSESSINDDLKTRLSSISDMQPTFPVPPTTTSVYLSHVGADGMFYIRFPGRGLIRSDQLTIEICEHFSKGGLKAAEFVSKPKIGDIVWARYSKDGTLYRALIQDIHLSTREVSVYFVDYGNKDVIKASCLRRPLKIAHMYLVPHQAMKCLLADWPSSLMHVWEGPFAEEAVERLGDDTLEVEVVGSVSDGVPPQVRFYRATEDGLINYKDELLALLQQDGKTINDAVDALQNDISSAEVTEHPAVTPATPPTRNDRDIGGTVARSVVSTLRIAQDWLDVVVSHVASPSFFAVQLLSSFDKLAQLKDELAQYYDNIPEDELCANAFVGMECVVYDVDGGRWCRAVVKSTGSEGVVVFYSDWGACKLLAQSQLCPLHAQFKQLPYQAIVCSLAGISSKCSADWSPKAVKRLVELIAGHRAYVVKIVSRRPSEHSIPFQEHVFELDFYDTSSPRDKCFNDILVSEGLAKWIC